MIQQQRRQQQQQQQQRQYQFDQILVSHYPFPSFDNNILSSPSCITPALLSYDRKAVYAGLNANWKFNFKDIVSVDEWTGASATTPAKMDQQHRSRHWSHDDLHHPTNYHSCSNSSGRGAHGEMTSHTNENEKIIMHTLTLTGRKIRWICIVRMMNSSSNNRQRHWEQFVSGLQSTHHKVVPPSKKNHVMQGERYDFSTSSHHLRGEETKVLWPSSSRQPHPHNKTTRVQGVVTPAQHSSKTSSTTHKSSLSSSSLLLRSPLHDLKKHPFTSRVVVSQSPRLLSQTMKAEPHNLSESKDRGYAHYDPTMEEQKEEKKVKNPPESSIGIITGNVVPSPSFGNTTIHTWNLPSQSPRNASPVKFRKTYSKLPRKNNRGWDYAGGGGSWGQLHGIHGGEIRLREKQVYGDTTSKRQRLRRIPMDVHTSDSSDFDDNDSDEETIDANIRNDTMFRCRKKLHLTIDDDDDDDDDDDEKEAVYKELIDTTKLSIPIQKSVDDSKQDKAKASQHAASNGLNEEVTKSITEGTSQSKDAVLPKKKSIANFFAPRIKKTVTVESIPTIQGTNSLSTPLKKNQMVRDQGTTSPEPMSTPVPKLTQRKTTSSKYFSTGNNIHEVLSPPPSPQTLKYSSDDDQEEERQISSLDRTQLSHNRETLNERRRRIGKSRICARLENQMDSNTNLHRDLNKTTTPMRSFLTSKADIALGSSDRKNTSGRGIVLSPLNNDKTDDFQSKSISTPAIIIPGIQNLGNTCYLSASLQILFGIPSFIHDLYKMYAKIQIASHSVPEETTMPLTRALLEVAVVIGVLSDTDVRNIIDPEAAKNKLSSSLAANPFALKKQMDMLTDKFAGYEQRDAHEFLSDLVDFLHDELTVNKSTLSQFDQHVEGTSVQSTHQEKEGRFSFNENTNPNEVKDKVALEKSVKKSSEHYLPTDAYFHLNVRVCLECDSCGYARSKDEMYRHLSVDVGNDDALDTWTVQRCLKQFFQPEKREIKCEKCLSGTTATQTMQVLSRPKALLLHFKRFIVTQEKKIGPVELNADGTPAPPIMEMVLRKNKAKILLDETLSIDPVGGGSTNQIVFARNYQLRGVVHHVGNTAFSGHYTTCAIRSIKGGRKDKDSSNAQDDEEQWVLFDDRVGTRKPVSYVLENERNERNCYLALYELK